MARKRKPQIAWGIIDESSGYVWPEFIRVRRYAAIAAWCENTEWTWARWMEEGRACVKIRLEVLPDAD